MPLKVTDVFLTLSTNSPLPSAQLLMRFVTHVVATCEFDENSPGVTKNNRFQNRSTQRNHNSLKLLYSSISTDFNLTTWNHGLAWENYSITELLKPIAQLIFSIRLHILIFFQPFATLFSWSPRVSFPKLTITGCYSLKSSPKYVSHIFLLLYHFYLILVSQSSMILEYPHTWPLSFPTTIFH